MYILHISLKWNKLRPIRTIFLTIKPNHMTEKFILCYLIVKITKNTFHFLTNCKTDRRDENPFLRCHSKAAHLSSPFFLPQLSFLKVNVGVYFFLLWANYKSSTVQYYESCFNFCEVTYKEKCHRILISFRGKTFYEYSSVFEISRHTRKCALGKWTPGNTHSRDVHDAKKTSCRSHRKYGSGCAR